MAAQSDLAIGEDANQCRDRQGGKEPWNRLVLPGTGSAVKTMASTVAPITLPR